MQPSSKTEPFPFRKSSLPLEERVRDLLGRLTLDEKLNLLTQRQAAIPRLGIRAFKTGTEGLHGVAWLGEATVFPQAIGLGSTWNPDLLRRIGDAVAEEARGLSKRNPEKNSLNIWSPVVDLLRDPRAGRNEEGYSEDAFLTGMMSTAYAFGLRGPHPFYLKTAPTLKHFFAYNNEDSRDVTDAQVTPRQMREYYWKAFQPALQAGAATGVMTSYNLVNGRPNTFSPYLERAVRSWAPHRLFIVSDAASPTNLVEPQRCFDNHAEAHAAALRAGVDSYTELDPESDFASNAFRESLTRGLITEAELDRAIGHIFSIRIRLGEFDLDSPYAAIGEDAILAPAHRELAREAAREQLVLLKNNGLLPLNTQCLRRLAVIGARAEQVHTDHYSGSLPYTTTPLEAIREALGSGIETLYHPGEDAAAAAELARGADVALVFAGNHPTCNAGWAQCPEPTEGKEAVDRRAIHLPAEALIRAVCEANPNTAVVLISSFPYTISWTKDHAAAILWSSHAGQEMANAIADALSGAYAPAGRLTQTWYASLDNLTPITDYDIQKSRRTYQYFEGEPLFPFGHGLTYTEFHYSNLKLESATVESGGEIRLSFDIANTGRLASDEVAQVYIRAPRSRAPQPVQSLRAFHREQQVAPGETRTLRFTIPVAELAFWDVSRDKWAVERGEYEVRAGRSSADIRLATELTVNGEIIPPRDLTRATRAENFDDYSGIRLVEETKADGTAVGCGAEGGWIAFHESDLQGKPSSFTASVANEGTDPARMDIRLDSPDERGERIGSLEIPSTGGRYEWITVSTGLRGASGIRSVYLILRGAMRIRTLHLSG